MKDRSNDPAHHEQTLLPRSYILFPGFSPEKSSISLDLVLMFNLFYCSIELYTVQNEEPKHNTDLMSSEHI